MVNILILNWNSADSARECLTSISFSDDPDFRVVLINNFSSEPDKNEINEIYESFRDKIEIHLIHNRSNLGYAGGNNAGLEFLSKNQLLGDIMILNPDVRIARNTIPEMKRALTGNRGVVSPRIMNAEGKILFDAVKLKGFFQRFIITDQSQVATDYAQGSCLLVRRDIIDKIGLFDERFFLYWEEVDFSLRVRKSGWELISVTSATVVRNRNCIDREPLAFYYSVRNSGLIKKKHPDFFSDWSHFLYLIKMFLLTGKFILKPEIFFSVLSNYFAGIHDSINNIYNSKTQRA
jgi:GT2 family glycosyltransferase